MIPLIDLQRQYHSLRPEIDEAVGRVLASGQYSLGEEVAAFEQEFSAFCGTAHGVAVNSGTSALHLALLAAGVGPGDEVITVPFTFVATVAAILYAGARPVFVDVEPRTLTMDAEQIESAITARTRVVLPVHLHGHPADMSPVMEVARRRNLIVIEDAAQAHGARYRGQRVGSIGDLACFSFYPAKNLGAFGEGGFVTTGHSDYAQRIRLLRDWGCKRRYYCELPGFNYRMDSIQAAILRVKLKRLDNWNRTRQQHAAQYQAKLHDSRIACPTVASFCEPVWHVYAIRSPHRDELQQRLHDRGIQTGIHYPIPVHLQQAYASLGHRPGAFPVAEHAANEVLSLPMFPELGSAEIARVGDAVQEAIQ